ncbi:unnamed protein product [Caenorhabditis auriculariae]|uniref:Ribonuclease 3 n=1 Tax=Caenorhabditis auriculariae TaxID=2777116 RepID=A0A8S1HUD2_9PELO|nr:unnamed protein product [Caenorhabditis auriculariae]
MQNGYRHSHRESKAHHKSMNSPRHDRTPTRDSSFLSSKRSSSRTRDEDSKSKEEVSPRKKAYLKAEKRRLRRQAAKLKKKNNAEENGEEEKDEPKAETDPVITEKHYEVDYLVDDDDTDVEQMKIPKSQRVVCWAKDAEKHLLNKARTTTSRIYGEFYEKVLKPMKEARKTQVNPERPPTPPMHAKCGCGKDSDSEEVSSESEEEEEENGQENPPKNVFDPNMTADQMAALTDKQKAQLYLQREVHRKRNHPNAVHPDICYNEPGMSNDGPLCRCSLSAKSRGMRHGIYPGEERVESCDPNSSNGLRLFHYYLKITPFPSDNQISRTLIMANGEEYRFEGFSILSHKKLPQYFPRMPASRWSTEYEFTVIEEPIPLECFTVGSLDMLYDIIFNEVFELADVHIRAKGVNDGCQLLHFMPRFVFDRDGMVKLLSTRAVMAHILSRFSTFLCDQNSSTRLLNLSDDEFNRAANRLKQNIVVRTDKKPSAIRVDDLVRVPGSGIFIVHNTIKPQVYSSAFNPRLQYLERRHNKMKHLATMNREASFDVEIEKLRQEIAAIRSDGRGNRATQVRVPVEGYRLTGLFPDSIAHVLMSVLAIHHIRYQMSLSTLETHIGFQFKNRALLELSMTHPSFKSNYGTNSDHAKNLLSNCAYRRRYIVEDRRDKKKGIHNLLTIMSNPKYNSTPIAHNERLEYLGDAVVEMVVTNRLFFMLPHHNEGGLATYRSSLVQNRNLASLSKELRLDEWIQFAHGSDLCHEADFRHALANAFEAIMAAVYLDGTLDDCDRIFTMAMFGHDPTLKDIWVDIAEHELKVEMPDGDRQLIKEVASLKNLREFEKMIGIKFKHIRLLAKAFTRRNIPHNNLTKGNNQRLEWLGDTVLQLVVSDYLYRHFPFHHEGHLSLLRMSIVSNKTQSRICDDLGIPKFVIRPSNPSKDSELRVKDKADLVEALIGAIFVDCGMEYCRTFIRICFLPRLDHFIESNRWNDPKSQLQQKCLSLRRCDSKEPDIPEYRTLKVEGPTNTRTYEVAVYFRNKRLAVGAGGNIHAAQMNAAEKALENMKHMFPAFNKPSRKERSERSEKPERLESRKRDPPTPSPLMAPPPSKRYYQMTSTPPLPPPPTPPQLMSLMQTNIPPPQFYMYPPPQMLYPTPLMSIPMPLMPPPPPPPIIPTRRY